MRITPPGELERAMIQHAAQIRARLLNPVVCKRPDEPMPEPDACSEPVEEKIERPSDESVFELMGKLAQAAADATSLTREEPIKGQVTCRFIFEHVAAFYGITLTELGSCRRHLRIVWPRHIAMYLARELTLQSLPCIGRRLGGKDHTTIIWGANRIEREIKINPALAAEITEIRRRIEAGLPVGVTSDIRPTSAPVLASPRIPPESYWTQERKDELARMWFSDHSLNSISSHFGRAPKTIKERASLMNLPPRGTEDWLTAREVPFS